MFIEGSLVGTLCQAALSRCFKWAFLVPILVGGHVGALSNWVSGGFKIFSHPHGGHRKTHRTNTSWFNWSNRPLCDGKQSHQPCHTYKQTLESWKVRAPNQNFSVLCRRNPQKSFNYDIHFIFSRSSHLQPIKAQQEEIITCTAELSALL